VTPERRRAFEHEWPELSRRLHALLGRKKIAISSRDDLVQETGVRLYSMWERVDRGRSPWPLALTILLNLLRDEARRVRLELVSAELPERSEATDVENAGIARVELGRVGAAMLELSPSQRRALLHVIANGSNGSSAGEKMARLRARRRLKAILERVGLLVGLRGWRLSETLAWLFRTREVLVGAVSCVACLLIGGGLVPLLPAEQAAAAPILVGAETSVLGASTSFDDTRWTALRPPLSGRATGNDGRPARAHGTGRGDAPVADAHTGPLGPKSPLPGSLPVPTPPRSAVIEELARTVEDLVPRTPVLPLPAPAQEIEETADAIGL
jgi:DNA-directed RNA polymerase specialized sigma24 family protein